MCGVDGGDGVVLAMREILKHLPKKSIPVALLKSRRLVEIATKALSSLWLSSPPTAKPHGMQVDNNIAAHHSALL